MEPRTRSIGLAAILVVGILVQLYVAAALDGKAFNETANRQPDGDARARRALLPVLLGTIVHGLD